VKEREENETVDRRLKQFTGLNRSKSDDDNLRLRLMNIDTLFCICNLIFFCLCDKENERLHQPANVKVQLINLTRSTDELLQLQADVERATVPYCKVLSHLMWESSFNYL
jgi:hypothetical protein